MSMEHYVFSDRLLGSIAEWQAAIDAEKFEVKLDDSRPFQDLRGFLPARFDSRDTGFECDHFEGPGLVSELAESGFPADRAWKFALAFRYGGDQYECRSAYLAAAAYAKATDGVLFDCEAGEYYPAPTVADQARKIADPAAWVGL